MPNKKNKPIQNESHFAITTDNVDTAKQTIQTIINTPIKNPSLNDIYNLLLNIATILNDN